MLLKSTAVSNMLQFANHEVVQQEQKQSFGVDSAQSTQECNVCNVDGVMSMGQQLREKIVNFNGTVLQVEDGLESSMAVVRCCISSHVVVVVSGDCHWSSRMSQADGNGLLAFRGLENTFALSHGHVVLACGLSTYVGSVAFDHVANCWVQPVGYHDGRVVAAELYAGLCNAIFAFETHGIVTKVRVDICPIAVSEMHARFRCSGILCADALDKHVWSHIEGTHILIACPPCQPFTSAGGMKGFQHLLGVCILSCTEVVEHVRPAGFLIENVPGIAVCKSGQYTCLEVVVTKLREAGYQVRVDQADARQVAPQARDRIYITGIRKDRQQLRVAGTVALPCIMPCLATFGLPQGLDEGTNSDLVITDQEISLYSPRKRSVSWHPASSGRLIDAHGSFGTIMNIFRIAHSVVAKGSWLNGNMVLDPGFSAGMRWPSKIELNAAFGLPPNTPSEVVVISYGCKLGLSIVAPVIATFLAPVASAVRGCSGLGPDEAAVITLEKALGGIRSVQRILGRDLVVIAHTPFGTMTIEVGSQTTAQDLVMCCQDKFEKLSGAHACFAQSVRVQYNGRHVEPCSNLTDLGVVDGDVIRLIGKLKGGMTRPPGLTIIHCVANWDEPPPDAEVRLTDDVMFLNIWLHIPWRFGEDTAATFADGTIIDSSQSIAHYKHMGVENGDRVTVIPVYFNPVGFCILRVYVEQLRCQLALKCWPSDSVLGLYRATNDVLRQAGCPGSYAYHSHILCSWSRNCQPALGTDTVESWTRQFGNFLQVLSIKKYPGSKSSVVLNVFDYSGDDVAHKKVFVRIQDHVGACVVLLGHSPEDCVMAWPGITPSLDPRTYVEDYVEDLLQRTLRS